MEQREMSISALSIRTLSKHLVTPHQTMLPLFWYPFVSWHLRRSAVGSLIAWREINAYGLESISQVFKIRHLHSGLSAGGRMNEGHTSVQT